MTDREQLFNHWAGTYDQSLVDSAGFPFEGYLDVLAEIFASAEGARHGTVLDVGTGTGTLAALFSGSGAEVTGIDFASEMLEIAKHNVPNADFLKVDLLEDFCSALPSRTFDSIVSSYVFHEFSDEVKLRIIRRLVDFHLKPSGKLIIGDIAFRDDEHRARTEREHRAVWDPDEYYWSAADIKPVLHETGLTVSYKQISFCGGVFCLQQQK